MGLGKQSKDFKDGVIRYYKGDEYESIKRKTNYKDILDGKYSELDN